jgi:hypothetical protein
MGSQSRDGIGWRPQGDSNPCCRRERVLTWTFIDSRALAKPLKGLTICIQSSMLVHRVLPLFITPILPRLESKPWRGKLEIRG